MQPVIEILEKEYIEAEAHFDACGYYGWISDIEYKIHTITNFGHYPYYPNNTFTIWN